MTRLYRKLTRDTDQRQRPKTSSSLITDKVYLFQRSQIPFASRPYLVGN